MSNNQQDKEKLQQNQDNDFKKENIPPKDISNLLSNNQKMKDVFNNIFKTA